MSASTLLSSGLFEWQARRQEKQVAHPLLGLQLLQGLLKLGHNVLQQPVRAQLSAPRPRFGQAAPRSDQHPVMQATAPIRPAVGLRVKCPALLVVHHLRVPPGDLQQLCCGRVPAKRRGYALIAGSHLHFHMMCASVHIQTA